MILTGSFQGQEGVCLGEESPGGMWAISPNNSDEILSLAFEKDFALVVDYLAKNFPAEEVPRINVNKASAIELESGLSLKRSQAAAIIAYRTKNGNFKNLDELKAVPLIDASKIDAKKDRIAF